MADYISRDELLADLRLARSLTPGLPYEGPMAKIVDTFFDMIATYPTADVAPVNRGEWRVNAFGRVSCSKCYQSEPTARDFCPNCGAKMS